MMQGIDSTFAAAIFIGYHSSTANPDGVRAHTFSSASYHSFKANGKELSEGGWNAMIAGYYGVPVALVSGDEAAIADLKAVAPDVEAAIIKHSISFHSAATATPAASQALIKLRVKSALNRLGEHQAGGPGRPGHGRSHVQELPAITGARVPPAVSRAWVRTASASRRRTFSRHSGILQFIADYEPGTLAVMLRSACSLPGAARASGSRSPRSSSRRAPGCTSPTSRRRAREGQGAVPRPLDQRGGRRRAGVGGQPLHRSAGGAGRARRAGETTAASADPPGPLEECSIADWDRCIAVNLSGMFYCLRHAVPVMKAQRSGVILNVSTTSARTGLPNRLPYVASKVGVLGLSHNVRARARPLEHPLQFDPARPDGQSRGRGIIARLARERGDHRRRDRGRFPRHISMRTWIEMAEVGDMAVFLASDRAKHITAQANLGRWERGMGVVGAGHARLVLTFLNLNGSSATLGFFPSIRSATASQ
jgi:NAD(P)-dependent dehydrogenase (short-subunit alcohol dehydrogenase family)